MIGASTRVLALLGDPIAHSLSPRIQNRAIEVAGLDGVYVALRCDSEAVPGLIHGIARSGGGGNVTIPHKSVAARSVEEPSDLVLRTKACNTFWSEDGRIRGENTDVVGFRGALASLLGHDASKLRVLLLGAGGAARAALVGLLADGVEEVLLWNRTREKADALNAELGGGRVSVVTDPIRSIDGPVDVVVNATSIGLSPGDPLPVDLERIPDLRAVLDLVYRPDETPWVQQARELGIAAADGGDMLVLQGAEAFRLWWGRGAPLAAMRDALAEVRAERAAAPASPEVPG